VTTVTVAVAVTAVSFTEVAVTVTVLLGVGTVPGAVYLAMLGLFGSGTVIMPTPAVVGTDQVTFRQSMVVPVLTHPGLLTVATNWKCSLVPTVAVVGVIEILMPETIVTVAVAFLVVSACAVAVIVAVGVTVVVPLVVTVGTVSGAV
jgi:hypothetical protein